MTILPESLQQILTPYLDLLVQWLGEQVYERMLRFHQKHLLFQIHKHLDFRALEAACSGYHHQTGAGVKPTHRSSHLIRALLIRHLYVMSYREVEAALQTNLLMRWFVGYGIFDAVLDHTTLERFEVWVCANQHRSLFDVVLDQIDEDFPEECQAEQIGDTFAMRANAAEETLIQQLRHTGECLLRELKRESLGQYQQVVTGLDLGGLLGNPHETSIFYLDQEERRLRLQSTVFALLDIKERVKQSGPLDQLVRVQLRLEDVDKILGDRLDLQKNADGQVERVTRLPAKQQGSYQIGSATDREATYRKHGEDHTLGYNISLSATKQGVIREIQAATGAQPDQAGVASLIQEQVQQGYPCPPKLIYDQAAGAGKTRAEVERVSEGKTQLVAKIHTTAKAGRFGPQDFSLSADGLSLTCPNGMVTHTRHRSGNRDGTHYDFSATICRGCPLWSQCRNEKANPANNRRVFISDYQDQVTAAQAYNQTEAFQADMKLRPRIERIVFMLTNYDGARRARALGLQQADFQVKLCATVRNLRTWIEFLEARERRRQSIPALESVT